MNQIALSVEQAAAAAGVGRTTVFAKIRSRELIAKKVGRRTIILREDLEAWLRSRPSSRVATGAQNV
jgi:excisionase family DNA binding protein